MVHFKQRKACLPQRLKSGSVNQRGGFETFWFGSVFYSSFWYGSDSGSKFYLCLTAIFPPFFVLNSYLLFFHFYIWFLFSVPEMLIRVTRFRYTIWIRIRQTDTNPLDSVSQCEMSNVAEFYNSNFLDKGSISSTVTLPVFISRKPLSINIVIASAFLTVVGVQCGVPLLLWEREGEVGARDHSPLSEDAVPTRRHPDRLARRCCHHWKIRYFFCEH